MFFVCIFYIHLHHNNLKQKHMKRVLFITREDENVFILTDRLNELILPKKGEWITWSGILMLVERVEHNFDTETIQITVKVY